LACKQRYLGSYASAWLSSWSYVHTMAWCGVRKWFAVSPTRHGLRLLAFRGRHAGVGSRPLIVLLSWGGFGRNPLCCGRGHRWPSWPLSPSFRCVSHPAMGGFVHGSCRPVRGRWFAVPAITAVGGVVISLRCGRDGVCPLGPCGVSAACRPVSGVAGLVGLGPFLPPPRGRGGGGRGSSPR
jgi:hypothetical protein